LSALVVVVTLAACGLAMARCPIATRYDARLWAANQQSRSASYDYRREYNYPWSVQPVCVVAPTSRDSAVATPQVQSETEEPTVAPLPTPAKSPLPQTNSK
jgi:hypothetical protein